MHFTFPIIFYQSREKRFLYSKCVSHLEFFPSLFFADFSTKESFSIIGIGFHFHWIFIRKNDFISNSQLDFLERKKKFWFEKLISRKIFKWNGKRNFECMGKGFGLIECMGEMKCDWIVVIKWRTQCDMKILEGSNP